jgi:hypothetical protein
MGISARTRRDSERDSESGFRNLGVRGSARGLVSKLGRASLALYAGVLWLSSSACNPAISEPQAPATAARAATSAAAAGTKTASAGFALPGLVGTAHADVPPGPWRRPQPSIIWAPVKPVEPVLQLARSSGPPMSLTSSDGTGLELVALEGRAVVEDPLTFTELKLTFRNPQPRQLEGQFEITLPPGAAISRFAMRIGDSWQEGEVVELQAAREAYEDFLHRRQDPALLEKQAGNQFRARVFPIPPSGEKELIISYSAERPRADEPFRIYLRGLPQLQRLDIRATVAKSSGEGSSSLGGVTLSHQTVAVQKTNFKPDVDFEVAVPVPQAQGAAVGLRHQNLAVARIAALPADKQQQTDPLDSVLLMLDTSASRALGFNAQVTALSSLVESLKKQVGPGLPLRVVCFDQDVEEIFDGTVGSFGNNQLAVIRERRALGASDLGKALAVAAARKGNPMQRVLILTDGIATAGELEAPALKKRVLALSALGVRRLDVITFGGIRDESLLQKLVTAGLPSDGQVIDGETPTETVMRRLVRATYSGIAVNVPGSPWVWPVSLEGVQPGDSVLVYADLPDGKPFEVVLTDKAQRAEHRPVVTVEVARPLLERSWVNARIQRLMHQRDKLAESDPDLRDALKHQIVDLSTKFRVLSDFTALLVLETEQDYARFRIDRRALSDIMTVGATGIELLGRKGMALQTPVTPPPSRWVQKAMEAEDTVTVKEFVTSNTAAPRSESMKKKAAPMRAGSKGGFGAPADGAAGGMAAGPMAPGAPPPPPPPPPPPAASPATSSAPRPEMRPSAAPKADAASSESKRERSKDAAPSRVMQEERASRPAPEPVERPRPRPGASAGKAAIQRRHDTIPDPFADEAPPPPPVAQPEVEPYEGKLYEVMNLLRGGKIKDALRSAQTWRDSDAGDVLALIGLGEAYEALGQKKNAARAYGSLIDLFPGRADLRRFAGSRLERLGSDGLVLAADTFAQAKAQRPDHPASHRMLAYALLRSGKPAEAFEAIVAGATRSYPSGRFSGVVQILQEDVGLIAAAWIKKQPNSRPQIEQRLASLGLQLATTPSLRFVLNWETDANDVDFHIYDGQRGHAYYGARALPSGGELYADVTTGYGPECFTILGPSKQRTYPYKLQAHYYSRGPMGYGMGKLEVIEHDGQGGLRFSERPFVIMVDRAFVNLGEVRGPLSE